MDNYAIMFIVGGILGGIIIGYLIAKALEKGKASKLIASAEIEAQSILKQAKSDGDSLKKDMLNSSNRIAGIYVVVFIKFYLVLISFNISTNILYLQEKIFL